MLKEEKELRKYCNDICSRGDIPGVIQQAVFFDKITALIRAVREDEREKCAKVGHDICIRSSDGNGHIAIQVQDAIRDRK